jgi:hypothetical protein
MPGETAWVHDGPASGMLRGAPTYATWGLEFNQSRLHLASRACGASVYIPSTLAALLTGSVPLCLSTSGRSVALEGLTLYLLPLLWLSNTYRNGALPWKAIPMFHPDLVSPSVGAHFAGFPVHYGQSSRSRLTAPPNEKLLS